MVCLYSGSHIRSPGLRRIGCRLGRGQVLENNNGVGVGSLFRPRRAESSIDQTPGAMVPVLRTMEDHAKGSGWDLLMHV